MTTLWVFHFLLGNVSKMRHEVAFMAGEHCTRGAVLEMVRVPHRYCERLEYSSENYPPNDTVPEPRLYCQQGQDGAYIYAKCEE